MHRAKRFRKRTRLIPGWATNGI